MFEIMRWVSFVLMWLVLFTNLAMIVINHRNHKRLQKRMAQANAIIFGEMRNSAKQKVVLDGGKLCDYCQNGGDGCSVAAGRNCTRFLPMEGTNLTEFNGVVETPPDIGVDEFCDLFVDWIESRGWRCCAIYKPYKDKEVKE